MKNVKVAVTATGAGTVTAVVPILPGKKPLMPSGGTAVSTAAVTGSWLLNVGAGGAADGASLARGTAYLLGTLSANTPTVLPDFPELAHLVGAESFTLSVTFGAAGTAVFSLSFSDSTMTELDVMRDRAG